MSDINITAMQVGTYMSFFTGAVFLGFALKMIADKELRIDLAVITLLLWLMAMMIPLIYIVL